MDIAKIVTATATQRWSRRRFMGGAVSVAALGSFATACGSGADQPASAPTPASPLSGTSTSLHRTPDLAILVGGILEEAAQAAINAAGIPEELRAAALQRAMAFEAKGTARV